MSISEKQSIEYHTAQLFLKHYNSEYRASFAVLRCQDAPDIVCRDRQGNLINLEITLTEDRELDIAAALGRSETRSVECLKKDMDLVREGKRNVLDTVSSLQGNVLDNLVHAVQSKLTKDYGQHTALVVRSVSGVQWSWKTIKDDLIDRLDLLRNPFDKGIWIMGRHGEGIVRLI